MLGLRPHDANSANQQGSTASACKPAAFARPSSGLQVLHDVENGVPMSSGGKAALSDARPKRRALGDISNDASQSHGLGDSSANAPIKPKSVKKAPTPQLRAPKLQQRIVLQSADVEVSALLHTRFSLAIAANLQQYLVENLQEPEQCLGRTGDEEDALVEQQQRRRAARSSAQSAPFIRPRRRVRSSSRTKSRTAQLSAQIHLMSSADLDSKLLL
jgi:hypothetical protein